MRVLTTKSEDQILVEGLRKGSLPELEKIYRTFFPAILGMVKKHGGNAEDAKDVFQDGVMVMYRMVQKPDFQLKSAFLTLLYPICRNVWFKSLRKRPYYVEVEESEAMDEAQTAGIEEEIHARTIDDLFRKKLNSLGEQCRTILDLFFEGVSMKQIVEQLGLSSVSFAKKKKFQCKEKLVGLVKADPLFKELKF